MLQYVKIESFLFITLESKTLKDRRIQFEALTCSTDNGDSGVLKMMKTS